MVEEITDWFSEITIMQIGDKIVTKIYLHTDFKLSEIDNALDYFIKHINNIGYRQSLYQDKFGMINDVSVDTERKINDWYNSRLVTINFRV